MRKGTPEYVVELSKELRKNQTDAEHRLWQRLRENRLEGYKFRRQYAIGRYIADFYCSLARLVIEIDGKIHDNLTQKEYDLIREEELTSRDIKILRFSNEHVEDNINDVLRRIDEEIKRILSSKTT